MKSKPGPFAEKKNAKSPAPSRVDVVTELNAGAARDDQPPAPHEYGNGRVAVPDTAKPGDFDLVSESITDLAQQMEA